MSIDGSRLSLAESVPSFGTPLSILVYERLLSASTDTLAMPEFRGEIHPFLVSIRIPGSAFEQNVEARKGPIQQRSQIVFEIDFQLYVLVVLTAARFECLSDLVSRCVAFQRCPAVKTVVRNFHSVQFIRFALPDGVVAVFVD